MAIVGSHTDEDTLREGLYVQQDQDERIADFFEKEYDDDGRLMILTGSAGDGKSALIARGYEKAKEKIPEERVKMDATEARRRDENYSDRLTSFFEKIEPDVQSESGPRSAIAINYGLAIDYFQRKGMADTFDGIWSAIDESQNELFHQSDEHNISVLNLSHRETYVTDPDSLGEGLVYDLIDRFDPTNENSPFAEAYEREKSECPAGDNCPLQYNIRQLTSTSVKRQLARLFAGWSVVTGSYLNPRTIIDNIASLLLPKSQPHDQDHEVCPIGAAIENGTTTAHPEDLIWNATFRTLGTNNRTEASKIDPASHTTFAIDQQALEWATEANGTEEKLPSLPAVEFDGSVERVRTVLRKQYLNSGDGETIIDNPTFKEFAAALTFFNNDQPQKHVRRTQELLSTVQKALGGWTGRQRDDGLVEFIDAKRSASYRYLSDWEQPEFDAEMCAKETESLAVPGRLKLMAKPSSSEESLIPIPISFNIYQLLTQVSEGYTPNATDLNQSHAIRVLHSRLEDFTNKRENVVIEGRSNKTKVIIEDDNLALRISREVSK
ncbi:DNA phosphorothioation-dependent restriction protein DptF [Natrarchaeobaculum aegyptiacum]|uniref:DNA phosphorothioation-dependent restriction protein DptF n=1 Tax=Natrarchaeobaculum aegyptiacum TaxID=745377 RepID=A0A2Z2HT29_9EURY|nr:DNA phosphorothioation-dependent restriction protein DptF [Natrarchaeobaculum aegyptiacum]ARS89933.1 DNA phosphorothioation-dependent restriction protein DptF [Natrarchaeobaculum aegyptiacum]